MHATHGRHSKTPIASYCDGPSPLKNKFNIILHLILAKRPRKVCFREEMVERHRARMLMKGVISSAVSKFSNTFKNFYEIK
ncbi:hypothetical protein ACOSQ4_031878 [Xanthoceras sorbifolium]